MDNYGYQPEENNGKPFAISRYSTVGSPQNNYLVEVNSRSKYLKKPKLYKVLSAILALLVILLLIILIVVLVMRNINFDPGRPVYGGKRYTNYVTICTTDQCLRSAANLRYSMDLSVNPCDDFYEYTCGRWSDEHPNHGWFPSFSTFSTITERILISALNFLTSEPEDTEPLPVKQTRDFYKSCMDEDSINEVGLSVIFKYLKLAELPPVPSLFTKSNQEIASFKFDWLRSDAVIKKLFAMDVLIGFAVDAGMYNRSENVMYIGVPGQSCPLPSPLTAKKSLIGRKSDQDNKQVDYESLKDEITRKVIKFVLRTMIKNVTSEEPGQDVLQEATDVLMNITSFLDDLSANFTDYDDGYTLQAIVVKDYQTKTNEALLNNINKDYPGIFEKYLVHMFEDTNITIDPEKEFFYLVDSEVDYLPKVLTFLLTTSDIYLELYMWWVTVFAMIINTSSDIVEHILKQTSTFYGASTVIRSRSLDCTSLVNTFMGMALSYGVADKTFSNRTKPKVEQMLYDIKNAFVEHVNSLTWMDKDTKKATLEKSKEMISFIGYPEWLFEPGALENYYKGLVIQNNTYLDNMMSIVKDAIPSRLAELRSINLRDWRTDPTTVNAFNSFPDNAINVPMAILNFPIYDLGLEVLNYGAIGSVLGHELTHGFDNTGRKHDKFGNYKQWWTNETIETFEEKAQCFINQYDNFTIDGIENKHVQGKKTLGENLADNGGLNHAYIAYQHFLKKHGPEAHLPGFENFTSAQLFFIAFGSIWCETQALEYTESQLDYDEHCPNSVRVLGTLQNSDEFARAYRCPLGSKMNPRKNKCKIW